MLAILGGLILLPLILLWRGLRLALRWWGHWRRWRMVPLAQRNMTRATVAAFVLALCIGFAATGVPFRDPIAASALAGVGGVGLLYLAAGVFGSQGARFDVISVVWWGVGALGLMAALLHLEGIL
jgi:hypothetical protein